VIGNVTSDGYGVYADGYGTRIAVIGDVESKGQMIDTDAFSAIKSENGADVAVKGNIKAMEFGGFGVYAEYDSKVTVTGNIEASGDGILSWGSAVTVTGDVSTEDWQAIESYSSSNVIVHGNITATGGDAFGVVSFNGSNITVVGDVATQDVGVLAGGDGTSITITGDVVVKNIFNPNFKSGVYADYNSNIKINGNVTAISGNTNFYGVRALGGSAITVTGGVNAASFTVACADGKTETLVGDVVMKNTLIEVDGTISGNKKNIAIAANGGEIKLDSVPSGALATIDGKNNILLDPSNTVQIKPSHLKGYITYTDSTAKPSGFVSVKMANVLDTRAPNPVTPTPSPAVMPDNTPLPGGSVDTGDNSRRWMWAVGAALLVDGAFVTMQIRKKYLVKK